MERLAQFVSESFDAHTSHSPAQHLSVTSSMTSSAGGTLSPVEKVDVETVVEEDGTRSSTTTAEVRLSHGIRHIILQQQQQQQLPAKSSASASHRRHHVSAPASILTITTSLGSKLMSLYVQVPLQHGMCRAQRAREVAWSWRGKSGWDSVWGDLCTSQKFH